MPMLAAMAAPSSVARAEEVVMSFSPLTGVTKNPGNSGCGQAAAESDATLRRPLRRIGKPEHRPRLGLAGVRDKRIWTGRRYFIHPRMLLALRGLQAAFIPRRPDCCAASSSCPSDVRHQENAVDRHAAAGAGRAAALSLLCRTVRALFKYRRARSGPRRTVPGGDEFDPYRQHLDRPLRRHVYDRAA